MIRIVKMTNKYYGIKIDSIDDKEIENIEFFVNDGIPVILVNELDDLTVLDIEEFEVEMVTPEDK